MTQSTQLDQSNDSIYTTCPMTYFVAGCDISGQVLAGCDSDEASVSRLSEREEYRCTIVSNDRHGQGVEWSLQYHN